MKILLVYPEYPDTFWSFKHALKFVSKKASFPPLGLLTVSALLPIHWERKLIDLNTKGLKERDILWADYIFISAMGAQYNSAVEVIERCKSLGKKVVAGGPLFTEDFEKFETVDHLVLNEAEITLPLFLKDLDNKITKRIYQTTQFADIKASPTPDYSLINLANYSSKSIQYSRGCPYNCEFCDITALLGHKSRIKSTQQVLNELQNIYNLGGYGNLFFVDDNFIGNKHILKTELLPALINWMQAHDNPFTFSTEASINLADDSGLMKLMTQAGFATVFIGIETPQKTSLEECNKVQNKNRNLIDSVKKVQRAGIEVQGGFIVGFDNDSPNIFKQQIEFIQESGIISAMIGLLNAPTKSKLYQRLKSEGRILSKMSGDNTDSSTNIIPKMNMAELKSGYQEVIRGIYSGKPFYERVRHFLKDFEPQVKNKTKLTFNKSMALIKSIFIIGIFDNNRKYYWRLFFWSLFKRPRIFPLAITYSIYGYHFKRVFRKIY
ncbi:MAG: B12-binding domain-containing radical SAM protein [Bacteroidetes bacterium]|nr:B12-binding domain-containing radical SAM protein [Bacteroidota bacterium]